MSIALTLTLIDIDLSRPKDTLNHMASDFADALCAYERAYASGKTGVRTFDIRQAHLCARDELFDLGKIDPTLPLYAIACTDDADGVQASRALAHLEQACEEQRIPYRGGVAVAGGRLVVPCARKPRMGRMRRHRSEAIDRLVLAVRSNCAVERLTDLRTHATRNAIKAGDAPDSPNTILAACPVPACLYDAVANFYEARAPR